MRHCSVLQTRTDSEQFIQAIYLYQINIPLWEKALEAQKKHFACISDSWHTVETSAADEEGWEICFKTSINISSPGE